MNLRRTIRSFVAVVVLGLAVAMNGQAQMEVPARTGARPVPRRFGSNFPGNTSNALLTVAAVQGTDISMAVSSALSEMSASCGTVVISPGWYVWRTAGVQMNPCQTLVGTSVTILVNLETSASSPFLIVKGPGPMSPEPPTNTTLTVGNIRGITFVGPSIPSSQESSTGIQLGGSTAAETAQLINLYDVHLRSFGCGIKVEFAFQIAVFGGSIEANYDGMCFANVVTFLENINLHGTQILNNIDYGISQNQTGANTELNLISCSLDDNGQNQNFGGQVQIANGKLIIVGGHFENNRLPMITIPIPGAPAVATVFVTGAAFNLTDTNAATSYASFISVKGVNNVIELGRGVSFTSQGAGVAAVTDWEPVVNQNSKLFTDPYTYTVGTTSQGLPAYVGVAPNNYNFPTYDIHGNVVGVSHSYSSH